MKVHKCDRCGAIVEEGEPSGFMLEHDETGSDEFGRFSYVIDLIVTRALQRGGKASEAHLCRDCWGVVLHVAVDVTFPITEATEGGES